MIVFLISIFTSRTTLNVRFYFSRSSQMSFHLARPCGSDPPTRSSTLQLNIHVEGVVDRWRATWLDNCRTGTLHRSHWRPSHCCFYLALVLNDDRQRVSHACSFSHSLRSFIPPARTPAYDFLRIIKLCLESICTMPHEGSTLIPGMRAQNAPDRA